MLERRKYVRLNIPLEVNYTIEGKKDAQYKTVTKDISPNGARFSIEDELSKGTVLNINVKVPTTAKLIPIKAKIVWSKKENEQGKNSYDAGFEFIHIPTESKKIFFQYLCNLMYEQLKRIE